jgi:predicted DNA-binding transcriptional regulator AlpA
MAAPARHNLDRRADAIASQGTGDPDDLLTSLQVAQWLRVSPQWVEIGRSKNYGPPFIKLGPRFVRYRRGAVRTWLIERTHASTAEYAA